MVIKINKLFQETELKPISHKEFNEFIKGKGVVGRNQYRLKELKAMFGFKPLSTKSPLTLSSDSLQPTRYDSISTGIPYATLLYINCHSKPNLKSNGVTCEITFH